MNTDDGKRPGQVKSTGRYILIGLLTAAPLAITWWILDFLFSQLSRLGQPWVNGLARTLAPRYPDLAAWVADETLQSVLAALLVLLFLYLLGVATTRVVGQRLIGLFERLIGKIPFVESIYRGTKKFLTVAGNAPEGERRVVLIDFPSKQMKALGLITRTMRDKATGEELAAVYVPTSPNPTSGYIEIVPVRDITFTDWTFDQAMAFIVTGGSSTPEAIAYSQSDKLARREDSPPA
ncbi:MAG: DUF502 domain-containing protein [Alphaproteobacteria bacterium]|nr:MAG: DUF502 domain-containing protein [Alphaproteobacteria bacterium]